MNPDHPRGSFAVVPVACLAGISFVVMICGFSAFLAEQRLAPPPEEPVKISANDPRCLAVAAELKEAGARVSWVGDSVVVTIPGPVSAYDGRVAAKTIYTKFAGAVRMVVINDGSGERVAWADASAAKSW